MTGKRRFFPILALLLPTIGAGASANAPLLPLTPLEQQTGILPVSSEYVRGQTETGTGIVVSYQPRGARKPRLFLLTCAHLTSGDDVRIAGDPIGQVSLGHRRDNFDDIDLIELDPRKLKVQPFSQYAPTPSWEGTNGGITPLGSLIVNPPSLQAWKKLGQPSLQVSPSGDTLSQAFALMPPWSAKVLALPSLNQPVNTTDNGDFINDDEDDLDDQNGLSYNGIDGTYGAPARIAPGMSCAPLISPDSDPGSKNLILRGMGAEFRDEMLDSRFTSDRMMVSAITAYAKGQRGDVDQARWHIQKGLLYMTLGRGSSEIVPTETHPGNGGSTSPGNGGSTSPGNGGSTSPANGAATSGPSCNPKALSGQTLWQKIGSPPAILWDGKPAMAILLSGYPIYPNHTGLAYALALQNAKPKWAQLSALPLGSPILSLWDKKARGSDLVSAPLSLESNTVGKEGTGDTRIDRLPESLRITLHGPPPQNDKVVFELNQYGAVVGDARVDPKQFLPEVEVKGPSGQVYVVDLTGLFFNDLRSGDETYDILSLGALGAGPSLMELEPTASRSAFLNAVDGAVAPVRGGPNIYYHVKCSEHEYHFNFDSAILAASYVQDNCLPPSSDNTMTPAGTQAIQAAAQQTIACYPPINDSIDPNSPLFFTPDLEPLNMAPQRSETLILRKINEGFRNRRKNHSHENTTVPTCRTWCDDI